MLNPKLILLNGLKIVQIFFGVEEESFFRAEVYISTASTKKKLDDFTISYHQVFDKPAYPP